MSAGRYCSHPSELSSHCIDRGNGVVSNKEKVCDGLVHGPFVSVGDEYSAEVCGAFAQQHSVSCAEAHIKENFGDVVQSRHWAR